MTTTQSVSAHLSTVKVSGSARLHLGFLDLNGSIGRKFGSFGLAIDHFSTTAIVRAASNTSISAPQQHQVDKALSLLENFNQKFKESINVDACVALELIECIPEHAGFGSGTQFTLTVLTALAKFHQLNITTREIASLFSRGKRSGIGIATFDQGGFIVDGGNAPNNTVPPIIARHPFPDEWRIVLILDPHHQGIHGNQELNAFKTLPEFPQTSSQQICHITLMQLLPALVEKDLTKFGQAIADVQAMIGDHFAPAQGGRYTSENVEQLLLHAKSLGFNGIAQSSWGPTGCLFTESETQAGQLVEQLREFSQQHLPISTQPEFVVCQANNSGAILETYPV